MRGSRTALPIPGPRWGDRPERRGTPPSPGAQANAWLRTVAEMAHAFVDRRGAGFIARTRAAETEADAAWPAGTDRIPAPLLQALRADLARDGFTRPASTARVLGAAAVAAERTLGTRPFDTQLLGARALLDGRLAEMATGEGKSLTVALAAVCAALAGVPVHVITANDYLVTRDAVALQRLAAVFGLRVARVVQADTPAQRAAAYAADIACVTAKELVFDYLRDGLAPPTARALRGLCMAIVDEADAILIDEARVPLILSHTVDACEAQQHAAAALRLAHTLLHGVDFKLDAAALTATLTSAGVLRVAAANRLAGGAWQHRAHREHAVSTALAALHLLQRERHYLLRDGAVQLIDETTGRVAAGRAWSNGLQTLVELKEGCVPTAPLSTLAQLTYPRFFARYHRLAGLSGTLRDARGELLRGYGGVLRRVPLRLPCRRRVLGHRLFANHAALWRAVAERVAALHAAGRPVLVAADSVAEAQALSNLLAAHGLPHATLHARHDAGEAAIVARAGQPGAITVSTNMAGRGTDIALTDASRAAGGLHLVCCQLNAARRIDRQLAGRAARQGEPGSVETWLSLDTALLSNTVPPPLRAALARIAPRLPSFAVRLLARWPQRREEGRQREQRRRLAMQDAQRQRQLGFAGRGE